MSVETVHLFLNPAAGRGRAGKRGTRIRELLNEGGFPLEVHLSQDVGNLEEQVRDCVEHGGRRIVAVGGDGSVHEATNGIMRAKGDAMLGVIPSGTGNDFAKAAGITLDWEHATRLLTERIAAGERPRCVDVGKMNDRYFANGAGVGFDARVTRIARSYRLPIGDFVYLLAIFRGMAEGIGTPHMRISTDNNVHTGPITLANVASGPWIGGMFNIVPTAKNDDGKFDLLIVEPVSRPRILALLPKLMSGRHMDEKEVTHEAVTRILIESEEPVDSHLDGEMQPMQKRFEIELLPGALSLF
ncbi:MAG: diacylglycerol kinase family protein [Woeseiaceae bacterium]